MSNNRQKKLSVKKVSDKKNKKYLEGIPLMPESENN